MSSFQYTVLPSASQAGELPLYLAFKGVKSDKRGLPAIGYLSGLIAVPISIAFTPVGIVADIVIGLAEAVFIACKGAKRREVQELLLKKMIASPLQQTLSMITRTALFVICPCLWPLSYSCSQGIIKTLPNSLNHKKMNIFINGGITDKGSKKTWFDEETELVQFEKESSSRYEDAFPKRQTPFEKQSRSRFEEAFSNKQTPLKMRIAEVIASVSRINNAHTPHKYSQFKQKILNQNSAESIFELNDQFTQVELLKKYKTLTLIVHPDKNPDCHKEAELLFHCLQEAYLELKNLAR